MALFDSLLNLTPDQNQGLLAAAAQLLQAGGPSLRPTSFGQALGGGLQAFQQGISDAEQRRAQLQNQALNAKLLGLNIQDKEGDLQNQAATRQRAQALQDFYRNRSQPTNPAAQVPAGQTADLAPTVANANALPSPTSPATGGVGTQELFRQNLQEAQALRAAGFGPEADAREAAALKFQPKIKDWQKVNVGGRVLFAPFFEDGTSGAPVPLDVAEKLQQVDIGGAQQLVNPFTGQVVTSTAKSATPGERLTASTAANRLAFDIGQANRPAFNAEAGGYILPVNKTNPQGGVLPVPGISKKLTEDQAKATGWLVQAEQAFENLKKVGIDQNGQLTAAARPGIGDAIANIPGLSGVGNYLRTANRQQFNQATSSLGEALLRAATGAGVNKDEAKQKIEELTPVFGEDPATSAQKIAAIPAYIETLRVRAGGGAQQAAGILNRTRAQNNTSGWSITKVGE